MLDHESNEVIDGITDLKADVQGENMRLLYDDDGETVEGYVIKEDSGETKEYEVKDGERQEAFAVSMAWVTWPLGVIAPYSLAAIGAEAAGSEAIDGRQAEVYTIDMTKADATVVAGVQAFIGEGISAAVGKVWVDQETGALLKMDIDWEEDVYDVMSGEKDAPPVGHGSGHFEIEVSQVGQVSVSLP